VEVEKCANEKKEEKQVPCEEAEPPVVEEEVKQVDKEEDVAVDDSKPVVLQKEPVELCVAEQA